MKSNRRGFALLIMAVLLVAMGAFLLKITPLESTKERKATITTQKKLKEIRKALSIYYTANATIPCSADITLATSAALFGTASAAPCVGTTEGAVPTRTLGLPDDYAFDEWGNRFSYYADSSATNLKISQVDSATAYTPLTDNLGTAITNGQVNVVVVSHGKDGKGATKRKEGKTTPTTCSGSASATDAGDNENCDGDLYFYSSNKTATYDDLTTYFAAGSSCSAAAPCPVVLALLNVIGGGSGSAYTIFKLSNTGVFNTTPIESVPESCTADGINKCMFNSANSYGWTRAMSNGQFADVPSCVLMSNTGYTVCGLAVDYMQTGAMLINPDAGVISTAKATFAYAGTTTVEEGNQISCVALSTTKVICAQITNYAVSDIGATVITLNAGGTLITSLTPSTTKVAGPGSPGNISCAKSDSSTALCLIGQSGGTGMRVLKITDTGAAPTLSISANTALSAPIAQRSRAVDCASAQAAAGAGRVVCGILTTTSGANPTYLYGVVITTGTPPTFIDINETVAAGTASPTGSVQSLAAAISGTSSAFSESLSCNFSSTSGTTDIFNCFIAYDIGSVFANGVITINYSGAGDGIVINDLSSGTCAKSFATAVSSNRYACTSQVFAATTRYCAYSTAAGAGGVYPKFQSFTYTDAGQCPAHVPSSIGDMNWYSGTGWYYSATHNVTAFSFSK